MSYHPTDQRIVVGVDGSPSSQTAVRWAAREAVLRNVPLHLVHLIDTPPWGSLAFGREVIPRPPESREWQEAEGEKVIEAALKLAQDAAGGSALPKLEGEVRFAATGPALVEMSRQAQLVVVGSRGNNKLIRILLGSVTTGLIHHAHCPVAVIHGQLPDTSQPSQLPVLVGIDGSPASELATAIAFDEASRRGVELVALHAWSDADVSDIPHLDWSSQQLVGERALAERLAGWRERYPDVSLERRIVLDAPALHILDEARSSQLVVVGSHGRGRFSGMLLGSVSMAVAQAASVPVIVARQPRIGRTT